MNNVEETIRWNGDCSCTPYCEVCGFEGRATMVHSEAAARARTHLMTKKHQDNFEKMEKI